MSFLPIFLLLSSVHGVASVGKILYVAGSVSVDRGTLIALVKGDLLEEGDVIVTGQRARAQLLMMDGGRISVRANSRLQIEAYRVDQATASTITTSGAEGEVSLNLLKGGLRTITGAIGKADRDDYTMRTPVATLGICGTDSKPPADGTYRCKQRRSEYEFWR